MDHPESWRVRIIGQDLVDALLADPSTQPGGPLSQAIERRRDFDIIASIGANVEGKALAAALVAELWQSDRFAAALDGDFFRSLWPHIGVAAGAAQVSNVPGALQ